MINEAAFNGLVGAEIRRVREYAGASGEEIAELLGVTRQTYYRFERGMIPLSLYRYLEIMEALQQWIPEDHPAFQLRDAIDPRSARKARKKPLASL